MASEVYYVHYNVLLLLANDGMANAAYFILK